MCRSPVAGSPTAFHETAGSTALPFESALANPEEVPIDRRCRRTFRDNFVVRTLGAVDDESTMARLKVYLLDPEAGIGAADATRQVNRRLDP